MGCDSTSPAGRTRTFTCWNRRTPPMLPDEVREAVERMDNACVGGRVMPSEDAWQALRAHLLAREAEVKRLNAAWDSAFKQAMQNGQSAQEQRARAERAEALLRECDDVARK